MKKKLILPGWQKHWNPWSFVSMQIPWAQGFASHPRFSPDGWRDDVAVVSPSGSNVIWVLFEHWDPPQPSLHKQMKDEWLPTHVPPFWHGPDSQRLDWISQYLPRYPDKNKKKRSNNNTKYNVILSYFTNVNFIFCVIFEDSTENPFWNIKLRTILTFILPFINIYGCSKAAI